MPNQIFRITGNDPPPEKDDREFRGEYRGTPGEFHPEWKRAEIAKRDDRWRGLFWGLLLILIGALFLARQQGWFGDGEWWHYLVLGIGVIFIIDGLVHYFAGQSRRSGFGRIVIGIVLLFIGLAFIYGFSQWWPLALIAGGVVILAGLFFRKKRSID